MGHADLSTFFVTLVSLLAAAHLGGAIAEKLRMPRVIGEILAGLTLGPSVLGEFWPQAHQWLFPVPSTENPMFSSLYWIGLTLLMFISGYKIGGDITKKDRDILWPIVVFAIAIPFLAAWAVVLMLDLSDLAGSSGTGLSFQLVFAIAAAVTSIPVISRIFVDLGMIESRFAKLTLSASTVEDIVLWTLLSVATSIAHNAEPFSAETLKSAALSVSFLCVSIAVGPYLSRILHFLGLSGEKLAAPAFVLTVCFVFIALASILGINVIFGALVAGMLVGRARGPGMQAVQVEISNFALALFVPLYFALVGSRINLGDSLDVVGALAFLLGSSVIKIASVWLGGMTAGLTRASALHFGIAMNTRGGPGIVLASIALEAQIISSEFFTTLILAAIVTSMLAGFWLRRFVGRSDQLFGLRNDGCERPPSSARGEG